MATALKFLGLVTILFLGAAGWGAAATEVLRRTGWSTVREEMGPPIQVLLGVALFFVAGGVLVAADIAYFGVLMAWHLVGVALLVVRLRRLVRAVDVTVRRALFYAATGGVYAFLVLVSLATSSLPRFNPYDDDAAYIYLAKRVLATGGLVDPFNFRRLTSYGGSTLYQSMFFHVAGNTAVRGFEFTFASLLLVALLARTTQRPWFLAGSLVVGTVIALGLGLGPVANLSPAFSAAAFSLGIYQVLEVVSRRTAQPGVFVVIGILVAGLLALRFTYLISVGIATVLVVLGLLGRHGLRGLLVLSGTTAICTTGWAVGLLRSSGTPMYPLFPGNADPSWPSSRDPLVTGPVDHLRLFFHAFGNYSVGTVALAAGLLAVALLLTTRRERVRTVVLLAAAVGTIVQLGVFVYSFAGLTLTGITRYEAPSSLACGLLAIDALWPTRRPVSWELTTRIRRLPLYRTVALRPARMRASIAGAVTLVPAAAMIVLIIGRPPAAVISTTTSTVRSGASSVHSGTRILLGSSGAFGDRYGQFRREYRGIDGLIPRGSKVLAAVDQPTLLDPVRFDFATLDVPGAVSPPPHMPYFKGSGAVVRYLRRLGFGYIVTQSGADNGLYWTTNYVRVALRLPDYHDRAWAPYVLDWQRTIARLELQHPAAVQRRGSLALIRLTAF